MTIDQTDCMWWIGFDSNGGRLLAGTDDIINGHIPPKTTVRIETSPQIVHFRGWRLCVHVPTASDFLIHSITAGTRTVTAACGAIPADAFASRLDKLMSVDELFKRDGYYAIKLGKTGAELLGNDLNLPIVYTGASIALTVENISVRKSRFVAGMLGFGPPHGT